MDAEEIEPFSHDVYIGFSPKDAKTVKILHAQLQKNGLSCSLREIQYDIQPSIKEGVETSKKCLLFITSDYLQDQWYNIETAEVLRKVKRFGRDTLIVVKSESLEALPDEFKGIQDAVLTKEKLNTEKEIEGLALAIRKEPRMKLKYGPAAGYFHGYLNIILPDFRERVTKAVPAAWLPNTVKKMLIIVPESCICPTSMDIPGKIEFTNTFVILAGNRAGNQRRDYKNSMYKVIEGNNEYYFAGEFTTPLVTLYETYKAQICNMTPDKLKEERNVFYYTLKALLNHPDNARCRDQYKVVMWSDPETKKSNRLDLHQFLLSVLKKELELERRNESSKALESAEVNVSRSEEQLHTFVPTVGMSALYESIGTYPMTKNPRGKCLIINNIKFMKSNLDILEERRGSEHDTVVLKKLFEDLRFDVETHQNVTYNTLESLLITMNKIDHSRYDAFICCILSHGKLGEIYTSDGKPVDILTIVDYFADSKCPTLKGKPKMFFIQACQSGENDAPQTGSSSIQVEPDFTAKCTIAEPDERLVVESDAVKSLESPSLAKVNRSILVPSSPDFLMSYSTLPGSVSYRDTNIGSFYIHALDEYLRKGDEIDRALKQVTKNVREKLFERRELEGLNLSQQLPFHLTSAMERLIYLN